MHDDAITDLQEKLTHLERHVGELDALVLELNRDNASLRRRLDQVLDQHRQLTQRLDEADADADAGTETDPDAASGQAPGVTDQQLRDDRPPHW